MAENRDKTEERPQNKNLKRDAGPGRPKGQRNYATIYKAALKKIAEAKNMTSEEIEEMLVKTGLGKALEGDYKFYKDVQDRIHGQATQKVDVQAEVKPLIKLDE